MGRTAIAWGSAAAHNLAAYSQSELGFATHFNMYPEVQLPSPNGSLGHTRGLVNCAVARSKALIGAGMPVYFVWTKSRISQMERPNPLDLTVCPTPDVMAFPLTIVPKLRTCKLIYLRLGKRSAYEAVLRPSCGQSVAGSRPTATQHRAGSQNRFVCTTQGPVSLTIGDQNAVKSCRWSSNFYHFLRPQHPKLTRCLRHRARRASSSAAAARRPRPSRRWTAAGTGRPAGRRRRWTAPAP
jgi:hypothetical protein